MLIQFVIIDVSIFNICNNIELLECISQCFRQIWAFLFYYDLLFYLFFWCCSFFFLRFFVIIITAPSTYTVRWGFKKYIHCLLVCVKSYRIVIWRSVVIDRLEVWTLLFSLLYWTCTIFRALIALITLQIVFCRWFFGFRICCLTVCLLIMSTSLLANLCTLFFLFRFLLLLLLFLTYCNSCLICLNLTFFVYATHCDTNSIRSLCKSQRLISNKSKSS